MTNEIIIGGVRIVKTSTGWHVGKAVPRIVDRVKRYTSAHPEWYGDEPVRVLRAALRLVEGKPKRRARRTDPQTSHDAAARVTDKQRGRILRWLSEHGPATCDEIDVALFDGRNVSGRRMGHDYEHERLVVRLAATRPTRTGRQAHLWRSTWPESEPGPAL